MVSYPRVALHSVFPDFGNRIPAACVVVVAAAAVAVVHDDYLAPGISHRKSFATTISPVP